MDRVRDFLAGLGLPRGDLNELPDSAKWFAGRRPVRLGVELLARSGYDPITSELGAAGLAVPALTTA